MSSTSIASPASSTAAPAPALWSSRLAFILAAAGSAVGLGNIWKFPYITGENGGGAFVLVYLACIAVIGIPVMIAEVMLGRRGRRSPINSMREVARQEGVSRHWKAIGWLATLAAFLILSFYSVIAGWTIPYIFHALQGDFVGVDGAGAGEMFGQLLASPVELTIWHSLFMLPVAFGQMPGGSFFATLFFVLLLFAAWTSALSMLEAVVQWLEEQGMGRRKAAISGGLAAWGLGLTTVLSLNVWSGFTPLDGFARFEGKTLFDLYDFLTANVMMPLVALLTAVFVGWVMKKSSSKEELGGGTVHRLWLFIVRYLTPVALVVLFLYNL